MKEDFPNVFVPHNFFYFFYFILFYFFFLRAVLPGRLFLGEAAMPLELLYPQQVAVAGATADDFSTATGEGLF